MPARDLIHDAVKTALINDGWTITHDPYRVDADELHGLIDIGAERSLAAQKGMRKIAVEIKSFVGLSVMADLQQAIGQYKLYELLLNRTEPERKLYLAISEDVFLNVFSSMIGETILEDLSIHVVVVALNKQQVVQWTD